MDTTRIDTLKQRKEYYEKNHPNDTRFLSPEKIGYSDEDLSDSDVSINFSTASPKLFRAKDVTIQGKNNDRHNDRIKGDELIKICHEFTKKAIEMQQKSSALMDLENKSYIINKPNHWLVHAGKWACTQASSEEKNSKSWFNRRNKLDLDSKESISRYFSIFNFEMEVKFFKKYERLYIPNDFTILKIPFEFKNKTDLSYKDIIEIINDISKTYKIDDEQLATLQLSLLKFDEKEVNNIFKDITFMDYIDEVTPIPNYIRSNIPCTKIKNFLNYFNALIFGVEASRINTTFLTGIMTLELIQAGTITYKDAFSKNQYGGIFPLATVFSGAGNFKARGELLKESHLVGLRLDRQYPQWLNVHLKEAKIIKKWLKMKKKINRDMLVSEIKLQLNNSTILLNNVLGYN